MGQVDLGRVQGKSIASINKISSNRGDNGNEDTYEIKLDDNTSAGKFTVTNGLNGTNGRDGLDGKDGKKGDAGGTIITANGDLVEVFDADSKSNLPRNDLSAKGDTKTPLSANMGWHLDQTKAPSDHTWGDGGLSYGESSAEKFGHARASEQPPKMNGSADVGNDNGRYAREGHVHPTDTSKTAASHIIDIAYPVGSIYMSVNSTNPGTLFNRGTWVVWGSGRVPVGFSEGDSDFGTAEKMGGYKGLQTHTHPQAAHQHNFLHTHGTPNHTHTGTSTGDARTYFDFKIRKTADWSTEAIVGAGENTTISEVGSEVSGALDNGSGKQKHSQVSYSQSHNHSVSFTSSGSGTTTSQNTTLTSSDGATTTGNFGSGATVSATNGNLQPYITCYMWKRTA